VSTRFFKCFVQNSSIHTPCLHIITSFVFESIVYASIVSSAFGLVWLGLTLTIDDDDEVVDHCHDYTLHDTEFSWLVNDQDNCLVDSL
jgi:hypothetical protein